MTDVMTASRRKFLKLGAAGAAGALAPAWAATKGAPAIVAAERERPQALQGLHLGDPGNGSIVVWSRSDRPARMIVEWSSDEQFFGEVNIQAQTAAMAVDLRDINGVSVFSRTLQPRL
jgi:alkaline phosphatase D